MTDEQRTRKHGWPFWATVALIGATGSFCIHYHALSNRQQTLIESLRRVLSKTESELGAAKQQLIEAEVRANVANDNVLKYRTMADSPQEDRKKLRGENSELKASQPGRIGQ